MFDKIRQVLSQALGIETSDIQDTSLLREDLGLDTTELTELVKALEKEYEITVPSEAIEDAQTVGDLVDLIETQNETFVQ